MITNNFLEFLKKSSLVYYVYQRGFSIYNLPEVDNYQFLVITDDKFIIPDDYQQYLNGEILIYSGCDFQFITTKEWFKKIENCDLDC